MFDPHYLFRVVWFHRSARVDGPTYVELVRPICDWLRSSRVSIASGFSPRSAITHKPKAPEERRRRGPRFGSCLRIVASCYSWASRSGSLMRHHTFATKHRCSAALGYHGAT